MLIVNRTRSLSRRARWAAGLIGLVVLAGGAAALSALGSGRTRPAPAGPGPASAGAVPASRVPADREPAVRKRIVHEGVEVELTIDPLRQPGQGPTPAVLREGDDVVVRFRIADTTTGTPLKNIYPAAWLTDREPGPTSPKNCTAKAQVLIGGSFLSPPELDLNVYHIVTLNEDATLTVVDPRFGFGGTKLLALVPLAATGQDWTLDRGEDRLFVAMPEVGKIAVVDTASWKVLENLDVGALPSRVALQPDGYYLWVAHDPAGSSATAITALAIGERKVAGTVPVGHGPHEIAFRRDSRRAFVTNAADGTISVIDTGALREVARIAVGSRPAALAYSPLADMIYATDVAEGTLTVLDAANPRVVQRIAAGRGVGPIAFAPGGRLGFVLNPEGGSLAILDAASNRLIQSATLRQRPDQIAFSADFAYVRHHGTEHVVMVPLAKVGQEGRPIPTIDFPAGQNPLGRTSRPTPAAAIVQAPGENAVLVANPSDKSVYYYKEGMAAPMGNFLNYRREPRAVLVVDRSLRDLGTPGTYQTVAHLRKPGPFDLVFFLDTPRIINCFPIEVAPDPKLAEERERRETDVELIEPEGETIMAGAKTRVSVRLTHRHTGSACAGVKDVVILVFNAGGWQARPVGQDQGDGVYSAEFEAPAPGTFYLSVGSDSIGLARNRVESIILRAVAKEGGRRQAADDQARKTGRSGEE
jgi:YVTN family beta-propeller protein